MTISGIPPIKELWSLFSSETHAALALLECGGLDQRTTCICGQRMRLELDNYRWRCSYSACRKVQSIRNGSFFSKSKLPLGSILMMGYLWISRVPVSTAYQIAGVSKETVSDYYQFYRQLVADSLDEIDCRVGGPGVIVEIDESKFGKRKYNRGHRVEGVWIVGGIERTSERKVFMCKVDSRDSETLKRVISKYVLPGSIIYSDMWKGYANIERDLGMQHFTVNHSVEFVSEEGIHTNSIEGTWCGMKVLIPKRNRTKDIDNHLWEYAWRKKNCQKLWEGLLEAFANVCYE